MKTKSSGFQRLVLSFGCLTLVAAAVVAAFLHFSASGSGPSRAVQKHLSAINRGDLDTAYSDFTREYKREHPRNAFRDDLTRFADQLPCRRSRFTSVKENDDNAEVGGVLTGRNGALFPMKYRLVREKGVWKIMDYRWDPPGTLQAI